MEKSPDIIQMDYNTPEQMKSNHIMSAIRPQ